jgi:hypothetical protein
MIITKNDIGRAVIDGNGTEFDIIAFNPNDIDLLPVKVHSKDKSHCWYFTETGHFYADKRKTLQNLRGFVSELKEKETSMVITEKDVGRPIIDKRGRQGKIIQYLPDFNGRELVKVQIGGESANFSLGGHFYPDGRESVYNLAGFVSEKPVDDNDYLPKKQWLELRRDHLLDVIVNSLKSGVDTPLHLYEELLEVNQEIKNVKTIETDR